MSTVHYRHHVWVWPWQLHHDGKVMCCTVLGLSLSVTMTAASWWQSYVLYGAGTEFECDHDSCIMMAKLCVVRCWDWVWVWPWQLYHDGKVMCCTVLGMSLSVTMTAVSWWQSYVLYGAGNEFECDHDSCIMMAKLWVVVCWDWVCVWWQSYESYGAGIEFVYGDKLMNHMVLGLSLCMVTNLWVIWCQDWVCV